LNGRRRDAYCQARAASSHAKQKPFAGDLRWIAKREKGKGLKKVKRSKKRYQPTSGVGEGKTAPLTGKRCLLMTGKEEVASRGLNSNESDSRIYNGGKGR